MISDFEWDEQKNHENREKHAVSFEEAQGAFQDPHRLTIRDSLHSRVVTKKDGFVSVTSERVS